MSEVEGLKRKLHRKLKISVRSEKNSTRGNDGTEKKWKNSKYETNKVVSDHDMCSERKSFRSSSNETRFRSGGGKEGFDGEGDRRRQFGNENSGFKRKRVYADRDGGQEGKFHNAGVPNWKSSSRERGNDRDGSFRGRERVNDTDDSFRGRERGNERDGSFRGRDRGNDRNGSFRGSGRGNARGDSYRGREKENDKMGFVRRTERGNDKGDSFRGRERRGNDQDDSFRGRERRGNDNDDSFRGGKSGNDRDDSVRGRERRNDRDDSVRSMERRNDGDDSSRGRERRNDRDDSVRGNGNEFSQERNKRDKFRPSRADKGNEDPKISGKRASSRVEVSVTSEGVSGNKLRATEKRSARGGAVKMDGGEDGLSKRNSRNKIDATKQVDQKDNEKHQPGPLEIAAKKLLRHRKSLAERSEAKDGVRKKKKRVIRIDPHDISNKRLDDGISFDGKVVEKKVDAEEDVEVSQNAQFRAIQPSPSILSFVEDNLIGRRRSIELRKSGYNIDLSAPLDNVPFSTSTERERIEEPVFRNRLEFYAAAKVSPSFPPPDLPEIAFAGRSNVGKSSLLNALTRQWGVVRTSDKPGLTQTINFFKLGPKLSLVDLPGYGFAYAKEEVKDAWEELVKEYVSTRVGLRRVCLLIDTKWGMKPRDHELIDLMERSKTNYQIVLTKTDAVFPIDVARRAMQIEETLKPNRALVEPVMMVSSKTGAGIRNLRTVLSKITRFAKL